LVARKIVDGLSLGLRCGIAATRRGEPERRRRDAAAVTTGAVNLAADGGTPLW
jgi:hypothetical protein